tara:strand:+ start:291 stop:2828 length:2538 start_codon:yes stop_codon:yes gene_type:complete
MDFLQNKLTRDEWNNLEIPVSDEEKEILKLLDNGYNDLNICINHNLSLLSMLKIDSNEEVMHMYLYEKYFNKKILDIDKKYSIKGINDDNFKYKKKKIQRINSRDLVKLENFDNNLDFFQKNIFEFVLIEVYKELIKSVHKNKSKKNVYIYTIIYLIKRKIKNINLVLKERIQIVIEKLKENISVKDTIKNASMLIEGNGYIFEYEDKELFEHQKKIYNLFNNKNKEHAEFVLYTAPTGTGKTLTPIGLSNNYKIIFVCVARHIGLALAKSAISSGKRISFAFGSEDESNIRLHNFSANTYIRHEPVDLNTNLCACGKINCKLILTGQCITYKDGKQKINHKDGSKVDIMICDVKSYLAAMNYMIRSNDGITSNIIMYWDEPTITLDHNDHELHNTISKIWKENQIYNIILSSATLPELNKIKPVIENFKNKFDYLQINISEIKSHDYKKSIPILNKDLKLISIHTLFPDFKEMKESLEFVKSNKTLLRYISLDEICKFIEFCLNEKIETIENMNTYFNNSIYNVNMKSIKEYYLHLLNMVNEEEFEIIYNHFKLNTKQKYITKGNGVLFTTYDAKTLTNGPTIFICEDTYKIASFYIQQSKIPDDKFQEIMKKISFNEHLQKDITSLEDKIALIQEKSDGAINNSNNLNGKCKDKRSDKESDEMKSFYKELNSIRSKILLINMDEQYIPNTAKHQRKWNNSDDICKKAFIPKIDEMQTKKIMELNVSNTFKVLLLLGIGVFMKDSLLDYQELMKKMATEQKLFMIIASSDYIYGTNYQFCHGIIGKDLSNMTQEKTIQSLGRIGRNNIQQDYSVRFRDDNLINNLFKKSSINIEANNMIRLLTI